MPSWSSAYVEQHTLTGGHSDTINHLSFSPDGHHLASCGDDNSLIIWNVEDGRLLYQLLFKSPVDNAMWHPTYPGTLVVGCNSGHLFQLHDFSPRNSEQFQIELGVRNTIHSLAYGKDVQLLAVGVGAEVYTIREVKQNYYEGVSLFPPSPSASGVSANEREERLRPVGLHFCKSGEQLLASYIVNGVVCWDTCNQNILWRFLPDATVPYIGSSALSPNGEDLVVYNIMSGVHVYDIRTIGKKQKPKRFLQLLRVPRTKHSAHVTYVNEGRGLVCGTTTGDVCVWDSDTGEVYQALLHDRDDVLQAVAGANQGEFTYVATGSTDKGQSTYIKIWRAKYNPMHAIRQVAFGERVTSAVRAVTKSDNLPRSWPLLRTWAIPIITVVLSFLVCRWVSQTFSWIAIMDRFVTMVLDVMKVLIMGIGASARILQRAYSKAHVWSGTIMNDLAKDTRIRLLLWLRLDELLVPRLPAPPIL